MLIRIEDSSGQILKSNFHADRIPAPTEIVTLGEGDFEVKYTKTDYTTANSGVTVVVVGKAAAPKGTRAAHGRKQING